MAILEFRSRLYALNVYQTGTYRLTLRDGAAVVPNEYYAPTETYAATHYTLAQINKALANGFINQTEYNETIALIPVTPAQ